MVALERGWALASDGMENPCNRDRRRAKLSFIVQRICHAARSRIYIPGLFGRRDD